ncbi:MAG: pilus assembly protein PilM [Candidatus Hydrogenedentota bacterium]|nr:MAG: pilus assembly protein PilM [Candidatus Hydrogenedentota bacterium]
MIFQTKSVGIDIQPDSVRIAVATLQGGRMKVLDLIDKEIPEAPEQETKAVTASIIRQAFEEHGLGSDTSVICLPAAVSINRVLVTPITDAPKIRQTLRFQIEPQIPYPVEQVIADYLTIRKADDETEMLAVAVAKDLISKRLEVLEMAGVDPQILTLDALPLANFYMNQFDFSPDKITALLQVGEKSSFLGFFRDDMLIGYRNLDGMPSDDGDATGRMVKEIQRSLVGFQPPSNAGAEVGTLCLAGANAKRLWKTLQEVFRDLPVRAVEFNERMLAEIPPPLSNSTERCQLAIALAHVGLGVSANAVNFRREEYAPVSALSRLKPNIFVSLAVLAVALAVWFGSVLAQIQAQSRQMKSLNEKMLNIFADALPGIKSPETAKQKIKQEQEKFNSLKNYSSGYVSPLNVLSEVTAGIPDQKSFALNDLAISDNVLRMTGEVDSFDDINIFKDRLEESPLLSAVKIDSAAKAEKGEKVNFRIRARVGKEPELSADSANEDKS